MIETMKNHIRKTNLRFWSHITKFRKTFSKITLENVFQNNFEFCIPKYLNFRKTFSKKLTYPKIEYEILEYE
jgi:hypothetical protein